MEFEGAMDSLEFLSLTEKIGRVDDTPELAFDTLSPVQRNHRVFRRVWDCDIHSKGEFGTHTETMTEAVTQE